MSKALWIGAGSIGGIAIIAGVLFVVLKPKAVTPQKQLTQVSVEPTPLQKPEPTKILTSSVLYVGEVFWGRGIEYYAKRSPLSYAFPFSGLTASDKQGFDAWVGDMECPITSKDIAYQTQVDSLLFNCRPEYTTEAAKWFKVMTLANNHTDNNGGEWGIEQTRQNLAKSGIQYFGDYNMSHIENICDVIAMPARLSEDGKPNTTVTIPMALCGFDYVGNVQPKQSEFEIMKQYSQLMPVVAMPHMGVEYRSTAEEAKVATYHKLIDNGADVVIGAHPHVVQNSENYKGRLIVYSTGNFMFDQQSISKDTVRDLGVSLTISTDNKEAITAYTSLQNCAVAHDDCASQLATKLTRRPVLKVSYDYRCFDQSSNMPKKASQTVCDDILSRATWKSATTGLTAEW